MSKMDDKETKLRLRYIDESISRMERNQNKFLDEDRGIERRLQKLEDYNIGEMKAQAGQVRMDIARIKQRDATSSWFWAKVISVAAGASGIAVYLLDKYLI